MPFHSLFPAVHIEYAVTVIYASGSVFVVQIYTGSAGPAYEVKGGAEGAWLAATQR